jgi:hypothetical protein
MYQLCRHLYASLAKGESRLITVDRNVFQKSAKNSFISKSTADAADLI